MMFVVFGSLISSGLAKSGNYEALCKAINIKNRNTNTWYCLLLGNYEAKNTDIWYCLALSGNYESLCKAINDKKIDTNIKDKNVLHFFK